MNKQKTTKLVLIVIFAFLFLYFIYNMVLSSRDRIVFQGYSLAISQLAELSETCEPFDVQFNDKTYYLINIECLQEEIHEE